MIPKPTEPLILRGQINPIWWQYWQNIGALPDDGASVQPQLDEINRRIAEIADGMFPTVSGPGSVQVLGTAEDGMLILQLLGDQQLLDPDRYYGTDATGQRGFHPLPTSGVLPVVTGEIVNGQPVFVYADDGSLVHTEIA